MTKLLEGMDDFQVTPDKTRRRLAICESMNLFLWNTPPSSRD